MIAACCFDFNETLVRCRPWIELEVRTFPRQILSSLAGAGLIPEPNHEELERARSLFHARRAKANKIGLESSHLQDLDAMLKALGLEGLVPRGEKEAHVAELHRACLADAETLPGTRQVVAALHQRGLKLAIISNAAYAPFVTWALEAFELREPFEDVLVSAQVGIRKPRAEMFELALERMGVRAQQAVHVGDDPQKDVAAARACGLKAVWYRSGAAPEAPESKVAADLVTDDLRAIPPWLADQP